MIGRRRWRKFEKRLWRGSGSSVPAGMIDASGLPVTMEIYDASKFG